MSQENDTVQLDTPKPVTKRNKPLNPRHAAIAALSAAGMTSAAIAGAVAMTPSGVRKTQLDLRRQGIDPLAELRNAQAAKKSCNNIKRLANGKPIGTLETVKDSTVFMANKYIADLNDNSAKNNDNSTTFNLAIIINGLDARKNNEDNQEVTID